MILRGPRLAKAGLGGHPKKIRERAERELPAGLDAATGGHGVLRLRFRPLVADESFAQDDNFVQRGEERLDQAGAEAAEEVFGVGFGLGLDFGLVAVFESEFLEEEVDGVFGLEALGD